MKVLFLQLAALSTAFILPDEQVSYLQNVKTRTFRAINSALNGVPHQSEIIKDVKQTLEYASDGLEDAFDSAQNDVRDKYSEFTAGSRQALEEVISSMEKAETVVEHDISSIYSEMRGCASSAKHKLDSLDTQDLFHQAKHAHSKSNMTVYQLISENKYTTKLAKLISEYDDLTEALNGTAANYTLFAPTDKAFERLPKHHKPSKEIIEKMLTYHVSPEFYSLKGILYARTIPTLLKSSDLGKNKLPQRLSTQIGWTGVKINFLTRVVGIDKYATNGVVHLVDSFIVPPFRGAQIIDLSPSVFSTLQLGLVKTGLFDIINGTKPAGGTLFAPSNSAFEKLGTRLNAFLFSEAGLKYLTAILNYHICPKNTLYSDAFYKKSSSETENIPRGQFQVDLPTRLDDRKLSIDVARLGRLIEIKINAYNRVSVSDIVADDGVIHIPESVLIPPKKLANGEWEEWDHSREMTVNELKERLDPYVADKKSLWEEL